MTKKKKVIASSAAVKNEKIEALKHHDDQKKNEFRICVNSRSPVDFFTVFEVIKKKRKQFSQKARYYMLEGLAIRAISFDWRAHLNHVDIKDSMRMRTATGFAGI